MPEPSRIKRLFSKSGIFATTTTGDIVKLSNGEILPEDEPLFLLRARDYLALDTLHYHALQCEGDYLLDFLEKVITEFESFKKEHPERMKQPGITRGK